VGGLGGADIDGREKSIEITRDKPIFTSQNPNSIAMAIYLNNDMGGFIAGIAMAITRTWLRQSQDNYDGYRQALARLLNQQR
jgi:hypothetical protein